MFDGFQLDRVDVGEVTLRVRYGGEGPPVVLLHGHPRTHTTWHRVAPQLSRSFFVVCPDLRGYGQSTLRRASRRPRPRGSRPGRGPQRSFASSGIPRLSAGRNGLKDEAAPRAPLQI